MDLFFDNEFRSLIPPLQPDERTILEESLIRDGNRDPVVIWKETKLLLDGHNRYDICVAHNIPLKPAIEISLPDRDEARIWIIRNQFGKRNLSPYSRSVLALKLEDLYKTKAKENQGKRNDLTSVRNLTNVTKPIDTKREIATIAHVSHDTIAKVKTIEAKATIEQKASLVSGESSINEIFNNVQNKAHVGQATGENEWYTPSVYVEAARQVMGSIDIDPASNDTANQFIKATIYYTKETNGLLAEWNGNVWLNPPYSYPLIQDFSDKLIKDYTNGITKQSCIFVHNSTETKWFQLLLERCSALCLIKGRINYMDKNGVFRPGAPLQGEAVIYIGKNAKDFGDIFSQFGVILYAKRPYLQS
jgi:hypothetical protein